MYRRRQPIHTMRRGAPAAFGVSVKVSGAMNRRSVINLHGSEVKAQAASERTAGPNDTLADILVRYLGLSRRKYPGRKLVTSRETTRVQLRQFRISWTK